MKTEEKLKSIEDGPESTEMKNDYLIGTTYKTSMSNSSKNFSVEYISLTQFFYILWEGKYKIILFGFVFSVCSIFYALSLPNVYSSTLKLVPSENKSKSGIGSLANKYGGLASIAGISLPGNAESNSIHHAVELMNSWPFLEAFVEKHDLKALLMAVKKWDPESDSLVYNEKIYNPNNKKWLLKTNDEDLEEKSFEPSSFDTYKALRDRILNISYDEGIGIFEISANHYSPEIAFQLTNKLKDEVNEYFRTKDKKRASDSIKFLEKKIQSTTNSQVREVFYRMIESHMQTIMMTEINEEYLITTLIPAKVSEPKHRVKPNRVVIVVVASFLGGLIGMLWVFSGYIRSKEKSI